MPRDLRYLQDIRNRTAAIAEARALLAVERNRCQATCAAQCGDIRDVLDVPLTISSALLAFADAHPDEGTFVRQALRFRIQVAREFRRLKQAAGG